MRKYCCDTYDRENNRESIKVIWKCVKKATRSKFSPVKRNKWRPRRTLEKIIKKDLMVNNIFENLVYY